VALRVVNIRDMHHWIRPAGTDATLVDQTRGAELEYRIIAVNKARVGLELNTVEVVL